MKLSIITVVKDDISNIKNTIISVRKQINNNFEHIVFDGMSSDGTYELLQKLNQNNNFKLIRYKDKNFYDGLNQAIKISKGQYIGILNSGDIYTSSNISKKILEHMDSEIDLIYGNIFYYSKNRIIRKWAKKISSNNLKEFFKIPHTSMFVKKKIIEKNNYYSLKYNISSDFDFILKCGNLNLKTKYLDSDIVFMQMGGLSTSLNNFFKKAIQDCMILKKYYKYTYPLVYVQKISSKLLDFFVKNEISSKNLLKEIQSINDLT